ncbi:asparagine synthase [Candidatus Woesearchaeota archaeon]|nr:asparagine synthase [Candidatus Woesearchaeota archaeon]
MAQFTILNDKGLIEEKEWLNKISILENRYEEKNFITDIDHAKTLVQESLFNAIYLRAQNNFGILFSGGLDSSLIALICKKHLNKEFNCYAIGLEDSSDIEYAKEVASSLKLNLKTKILSLNDVESYLKKCIDLLNTKDVIRLEIAIVIYAGLEFAIQDNCLNIFTGAGSEEIFAGYDRHIEFYKQGLEKLHTESWNGLKSCYSRDLTRDYLLAKKFNVGLLLPFLDETLIKNVMNIHPKLKTDGKEKKIILRELAIDLGLPKDIAYRKRTAAQYGSRISNAILKLTKQNGFKLKQDYINSL